MVSPVIRPISLPSGVGDADCGHRFLLHQLERLLERHAMADGRKLRAHGVGDARVRPERLERADERATVEHADRLAGAVDDREFALAGLQQRLHGAVEMAVRRQRLEMRHHGVAHRHAARDRAQRHHMRLRRGGEIDEDGDEDQDRIVHQPDEAEREGDELPDRGGNFGRAHVAEAARQHGAQHAAAVHREGRDQVEQRQEQVDGRQPVDQRNLRVVDRRRGAGLARWRRRQRPAGS